jgi:hypothetical protein
MTERSVNTRSKFSSNRKIIQTAPSEFLWPLSIFIEYAPPSEMFWSRWTFREINKESKQQQFPRSRLIGEMMLTKRCYLVWARFQNLESPSEIAYRHRMRAHVCLRRPGATDTALLNEIREPRGSTPYAVLTGAPEIDEMLSEENRRRRTVNIWTKKKIP